MSNAALFFCLILFAATGQILLIWCLVAALKNLFREKEQRS